MEDLKIFLTEERFPEGWQTKVRNRKGLTILSFNRLVNQVEFGIDEKRAVELEKVDQRPPYDNLASTSSENLAGPSAGQQNGVSSV